MVKIILLVLIYVEVHLLIGVQSTVGWTYSVIPQATIIHMLENGMNISFSKNVSVTGASHLGPVSI